MTVDSKYFTVQQSAEIIGVDDEQILSLIHSGQLPAVNVAKSPQGKRPRWRVAEADLAKFLMARRHPASMQQQSVVSKPRQAKPKQYV